MDTPADFSAPMDASSSNLIYLVKGSSAQIIGSRYVCFSKHPHRERDSSFDPLDGEIRGVSGGFCAVVPVRSGLHGHTLISVDFRPFDAVTTYDREQK